MQLLFKETFLLSGLSLSLKELSLAQFLLLKSLPFEFKLILVLLTLLFLLLHAQFGRLSLGFTLTLQLNLLQTNAFLLLTTSFILSCFLFFALNLSLTL